MVVEAGFAVGGLTSTNNLNSIVLIFASGRLFQPSLIYVSKSRAYLSEAQPPTLSTKNGLG